MILAPCFTQPRADFVPAVQTDCWLRADGWNANTAFSLAPASAGIVDILGNILPKLTPRNYKFGRVVSQHGAGSKYHTIRRRAGYGMLVPFYETQGLGQAQRVAGPAFFFHRCHHPNILGSSLAILIAF